MTENRLLLVDGHAVAFHCWYSEYPHSVISGFVKSEKGNKAK